MNLHLSLPKDHRLAPLKWEKFNIDVPDSEGRVSLGKSKSARYK